MACSKIFSGDLPELISEIIQYFHHDYKTLHSCILINKLWCRLAIPLLWEDTFSVNNPKNYHFIEIYLDNLKNDDDKTSLNEYVIHNDLFPSKNTLFNYPSFIKYLDTYKVCYSIEKWVATVVTSTTERQHSSYFIRNTNLSRSQISDLKRLINRSLFLIFIENEVNLYSFEVRTTIYSIDYKCSDDIFELILQNPNFICNIKNLALDIDLDMTIFLKFLYSNCKSISSLYFLYPSRKDSNYPKIEKSLSQIIDSQENLKKISFGYNNGSPLYHSLLSLTSLNNTLNTIIFYSIDFKTIDVLSEVFNQLNGLESIHIIYCHSLDSKFIQQINNITIPFKLKSLFLDKSDESLKLLIQKSGNYLENLGINMIDRSQQLLHHVIKYCNKIKIFDFTTWPSYNQNINLVFNLIENIAQNLNYLLINAINCNDFFYYTNYLDNNIKFSSNVLQNLGQILPCRLEYLNLNLAINGSDLEIFLKNSQNTFIKKFLIKNERREESEDIFPYIKEYIMKNKRVKYLAVLDVFRRKNEDLFSLKDKVKEFELYDIQVLNYHDLLIKMFEFIQKTY
jgi:hypothetical protein